MEEQKLQLLDLCEDARLEIFKYLGKKDMENVSSACKSGYDATKYYFEKHCQLVFSEPLSLQEIHTFRKSTRTYDDVIVDLRKCDEIILDQLTFLKLNTTCVRLSSDNISDVPELISKLKTKYKTIKKVLIDSGRIESLNDIQSYKDEGICTNDITSVSFAFNTDDFEESYFNTFAKAFRGLQSLDVTVYSNNAFAISPSIESLNVGKVRFHAEFTEDINFLKLFQGINTLIIDDFTDTSFLESVLELNKNTLKTLQLNLYRPSDYYFVIPFQLQSLTVFTECENFVEHLISNQNELEYLRLHIYFTPDFLENMANHCAPSLNITQCGYCSYIGSSDEIRESIPDLPMVKHLEINHTDSIEFLSKTKNLKTLVIENNYNVHEEDEFPGFGALNGLELKYLTSIDIRIIDENLLNEFKAIRMILPSLETFICKFDLQLLEKYSHIKYLETSFCNVEDILSILQVFSKLETLKVVIEIEDLIKVSNHFEFADFAEHLKYVEIRTRANSEDRFDILKKLERRGEIIFSNYKEGEEIHIVDVVIGIEMKEKQFMYTFVKV